MGKLRFGMGMSLDGYIAGPGGDIEWTAPSEELHRFHNDRTAQLGGHLLGRRLYETMLIWETSDDWDTDYAREFAQIWRKLPKVVFSRTLTSVEGNSRLAASDLAAEVEKLKSDSDSDLAVGGADLAGALTRLGLIDEYEVFVYPVVIGHGSPFFAPKGGQVVLSLIETTKFPRDVVYLRYARV